MTDNLTTISIAGQKTPVRLMNRDEIQGLWAEVVVTFNIYAFSFNENHMLLLQSKKDTLPSPTALANISSRIEQTCNKPCVFYFERGKTFERDRLVKQGVYFIVNSQYCFLPTILMNRKIPSYNSSESFTPATQRIVMFHLQKESLEGKTFNQIGELAGYGYPTAAKSVRQLEQLGLIELNVGNSGVKTVHFVFSGKNLWQKVQPYLVNPIKKTVYADSPLSAGVIGSINALAHYSRLNPDEVPTRIFTLSEWNDLKKRNEFTLSESEDIQPIEIWKYEPMAQNGYADCLSLALSLKGDHDPRVEKEVEYMIEKIQW